MTSNPDPRPVSKFLVLQLSSHSSVEEVCGRSRNKRLLSNTDVTCRDSEVRRSRIRRLLSDEAAFRKCPGQVAFEKSLESSTNPSLLLQLSVWRNRVAQWYYDVVDHLEVPREVVFQAMSFLDRSTAASQVSQEQYEIASITALFLAICLSTKSEIRIADVLELCGSALQVQQVQANGTRLLQKLPFKSPAVSPFLFTKAYVARYPRSTVKPSVNLRLFNNSRSGVSNLVSSLGDDSAHFNRSRGDGSHISKIVNTLNILSDWNKFRLVFILH